ncbi:hypothetical protein EHF33_15575 [Deinococcus psychrotolerans]|uniref:BIG2 domain-containing protein n=1 Tax=Deinococcus psychrotolerans TaxID=2489213 RepID=A0A3G8YG89_9DEIO|nr:hypothetical protein [Deinococcus psychrotolerans]AZI44308.1 hypothetical protein EHF33_15575 [Deinococcus psychrotolerans]
MKLINSLPFILITTLLLAACGATIPTTKPPATVTAPTISATPTALNVPTGQQQTASLSVTNTTGVTVSAAPTGGLSATISGNSLIVTNTAAAQGSYPLTLTATGPSGTAKTTVTVTVPAVSVPIAGDFSFNLDPSELNLTAGQSAVVSALVTPSGGFTGDVTYSVSGAPAGLTATVRSAKLSFTNVSAATGTSTVTVTATSGTLIHTALLRVTTQAAPPLPPGTPDFSLSATPSSLSLATGAQSTVTLSTSAVNNFSASLTYSVDGAPAGLSATISGTTLTVKNTGAAPGSYPLSVTASGGGVTHGTTVLVTVPGVPTSTPDFTVSLTPNALTLAQGQSATSSASALPTNSFAGNVSYSVSGAPAGLQAAFNGATLTVTNASAAAGSYSLTVTGTSGTLTHTTTLSVLVTAGNPQPPAGKFYLSDDNSQKVLPENGSISIQLYYLDQIKNKVDLTRPYTGALDLMHQDELLAQGITISQQAGKVILTDNGNTQPNTYSIKVKIAGAPADEVLDFGVDFIATNSAHVLKSAGVALDTTGQSFASYTVDGNNIGSIDALPQYLPFQGQNGANPVDITYNRPGPRNRSVTVTFGFGFAGFDTPPLPFELLISYKDGTTSRIPVTLQYQGSGHVPIHRYLDVIHSRTAQEQAGLDEINRIRASGNCNGQKYPILPPIATNANLDNGNREYAAYISQTSATSFSRNDLRLYAMLNGYVDDFFSFGLMQYVYGTNTPSLADGRTAAGQLNCEQFMVNTSNLIGSFVYVPYGSADGFWSWTVEQVR